MNKISQRSSSNHCLRYFTLPKHSEVRVREGFLRIAEVEPNIPSICLYGLELGIVVGLHMKDKFSFSSLLSVNGRRVPSMVYM